MLTQENESARVQAKTLLPLLKNHSVESIRALIGKDRLPVLREFDLLALRLPRHHERMRCLRLRKRPNRSAFSPELRAEMCGLVRAGVARKEIMKRFGQSYQTVLKITKGVRSPNLGRWNPMPESQKLEMIRLMKLGWTDKQVLQKVGCDCTVARKVRVEWTGKSADRRFGRVLSVEELERARQMLRDGEGWKVVAAHFGIAETKLNKILSYRKHDDPTALIKLEREKYHALVAALRTGKPISHIVREMHTSCKTLMRVRRGTGIRWKDGTIAQAQNA
jgi:uncharacterized protein YerC